MARRIVGVDSQMRVPSVTTPSLIGTLKSTRMNTRLPRRSRSSMVSLFMVEVLSIQREKKYFLTIFCSCRELNTDYLKPSSEFGGQELDQVAAPAGVTPLVVVPGQYFDAAVADDFGVFGVDDGRIRIAFEITRNEFFFSVAEDALHGTICCGLQSSVDGIFGGRLIDENGEVHDADVRSGYTHGIA